MPGFPWHDREGLACRRMLLTQLVLAQVHVAPLPPPLTQHTFQRQPTKAFALPQQKCLGNLSAAAGLRAMPLSGHCLVLLSETPSNCALEPLRGLGLVLGMFPLVQTVLKRDYRTSHYIPY